MLVYITLVAMATCNQTSYDPLNIPDSRELLCIFSATHRCTFFCDPHFDAGELRASGIAGVGGARAGGMFSIDVHRGVTKRIR